MISLDPYLARIGLGAPVPATEEGLAALHAAHATTIPFENLDIHLGRPITHDADALFDKMVLHRRGGYCFEQNGLFAAVLEGFGFKARPLLGRTTFGSTVPRPRGHLLNLVEIGARRFIADVGFGGHGLIEPVPFELGREHRAGPDTYLVHESPDGGLELSMADEGRWKSLYWFDLSPAYPVDVEIVNFYHSHAPASFFHQNRVVARVERGCRKTLTNRELKINRAGVVETRQVPDGQPYVDVLAEEFGIHLPPDSASKLRPLPAAAA